jgi:hypothetical protein
VWGLELLPTLVILAPYLEEEGFLIDILHEVKKKKRER